MGVRSYFDYPGETVDVDAVADEAVFLPDMDEDGWERLIAHMQARRFAQGLTVIPEGAADRSLYVVADGVLEVAGDDQRVELRQGAVLGELSFFDGRPHDNAVRALTDVDLFVLSPEAFDVLAAREPALARAVLSDLGRLLALRLRRTGKRHGRQEGREARGKRRYGS
jgi:CRP/FNR family transcriptional regulator, cyclic AMP receptor protein